MTDAHTNLCSEHDQHGEILLVVPDDHALANELYVLQHIVLNGHRGNVLPTPGDQELLYMTSDIEVT